MRDHRPRRITGHRRGAFAPRLGLFDLLEELNQPSAVAPTFAPADEMGVSAALAPTRRTDVTTWTPGASLSFNNLIARKASLFSAAGASSVETWHRVTSDAIATRREVIILQGGIADVDRWIAQLSRGGHGATTYDVFVLDPAHDGVGQVSAILNRYRGDVSAVHLVTHGASGELQLGSTLLNQTELMRNATAVSSWGGALAADGDFLLYGCDVAAGPLGRSFVDVFQRLTDADVAASTNATGHIALGGDFVFEYQLGPIETAALSDLPGRWSLAPLGGEFRLNVTTVDSQSTETASRAVAFLPDGSFVAVWSSDNQDGDGWGVIGRRFAANGAAIGGEFLVNATTTGVQTSPAIAADALGNVVVTWASNQAGNWDVFARRFAADGSALGGEFLVNGTTAKDQIDPAIAVCPGSDFVIVWTSDAQDGNGRGVYARQYDPAGVALTGEFRVNTFTTGDQSDAQVAMDAGGAFVVVWASNNQDGDNEGIYGQRFDNMAQASGGEFRVNTVTDKEQLHPSVAMNAAGDFVVAWASRNQDGSDYGVFAQQFAASGVRRASEFRVNSQTDRQQDYPSVAIDESGAFVVSWTSERQDATDDWGIYGQRFDANGVRDGAEFRAHASTGGDQKFSSVAVGPGGATVVVWSGSGAGDGDGVFARLWSTGNAGITVSPISGLVTNEAGGTAAFRVVLNAPPTADVTIAVTSSDTSEGVVSTSWLTFTPANWNTPQLVTITGVDDFLLDGDVGYTIILDGIVSADPAYQGLDPSDVAVINQDDDVANVLITASAQPVTTEAGGQTTFAIRLSAAPLLPVTVNVASSNPTEGTVSIATLTFALLDWNVPQTVTITGVNDFIDDGDVAYTVSFTLSTLDLIYAGLTVPSLQITNQDDDVAGFKVTPTTGLVTSEAGGKDTFSVVLTSQPTSPVIINLKSSNTWEGDVSVSSLTFTAANWNVPQTVTVTGVNGFVDDGDQVYSIVLSLPTTADANYAVIDPDDVSVTNLDDDTAGFIVSPVSGLVTTEAGGQATFSVVLTSQPWSDVTVKVTSSNLAEGKAMTASLIFTSGNWNVPQVVTVVGLDDVIVDGDRTYGIVLTSNSSDAQYAGIDPPDVTVTNRDDDAPGVIVSPINGPTTEAGGSASFQVALRSLPSGDVTVTLVNTAPGEGKLSTTSLVFTPADWNLPRTVTVTGVNDLVDDGDQTYAINVSTSSSIDTVYNSRPLERVWVTNLDDDAVGITVGNVSGPTTEQGGQATFSVALSSQPKSAVTVTFNSMSPGEGAVVNASVVFTPANWNLPQTVTVRGVDDFVVDGDVSYFIAIGPASSADVGYAGLTAANVRLVNQDNDIAGITVGTLTGPTTEARGAAYFKVVLDSQPSAPVVLRLSIDRPGEAGLAQTLLTFTPTDWNVVQLVAVTGIDDWVDDGDQPFRIDFAPVQSADAAYAKLTVGSVTGVNLDDDEAGLVVVPASRETTEAGGAATFTVRLTSQPISDVTINLQSLNSAEGVVGSRLLVFTAADWNVPRSVSVTGVDDFIVDGDVAYSVVVQPATGGDAMYDRVVGETLTLINRDDDVAGYQVSPTFIITKDTGTSAVWGIALTSQPTAPVVLQLTSTRPDQGQMSTSFLVFDPANWSVVQSVTVTGLDDGIRNGSQNYTIEVAVTRGDRVYSRLPPPAVNVLNIETHAPDVLADTFEVDKDGQLVVGGRGVLANDADADGDSLRAELIAAPANGRIELRGDGSFTYVPDDGFTGADRFFYRATDGHHVSAVVVVEITVVGGTVDPALGGGGPRPPVFVDPGVDVPPTGGNSGGGGEIDPVVFAGVNQPAIRFGATGGGSSTEAESELAVAAGDVSRSTVVANAPTAAAPGVSAPVASATTLPTMPGPAVVNWDRRDPVFAALNRAANDLRVEARKQATTDAVVASGAVLSAGYALLNTRLVYWFLSALTARPAVWRRLDPIDVLYAWEQESDDDPTSTADSLQSMVD